jgi:maleylpyruvate isomerase
LMDRRGDAPPVSLVSLVSLVSPALLHIGTSPPVDVTGSPAQLLAWLTGRSDGSGLQPAGAALPALPPLA